MTAPADKGKKAKTDADDGEENEQIDGALVHSIEKLQEIQDELEKVNEEASDKVLEVEQKYSEIRRPTYLRRSDDYEDEQGEYAARKYCLESSPICSTKKNYGQLGINTHRSLRHGGQRKPISVDKMYSSKPCSTTLSGHQHRIHAIDPEEADNEKCRQNENNNSTYSTKRRKSEHQDSSLFCFQKGTKDDISMEIETWYDLALLYLSIS